jgi:glyoxylase-like metal-dependent hydrolase (beta-lactamase superfamily II)
MTHKAFYERHIALLARGDVQKLVDTDYREDAVMILLAKDEAQVISGREQLKQVLGAYLEFVYRGFVSTEKYGETDDCLAFEATIRTATGTERVYDAMQLKDGQIFRHYSGVLSRTRDPLRVTKIDKAPGVALHCVSSGEDGELVNSVIIETPGALAVIDTMNLIPYSRELRRYADSLGKPIERVLITHAHPDHWFGLDSFKDLPTYALPETRADIESKGDFYLTTHRGFHGKEADAVIPAEKTVPTHTLEEGPIEVGGLTLNLLKIRDAEYPVMLAVEIPSVKAIVLQDLLYNRGYPFVGERTLRGERCFDSWIAVLEGLRARGYETLIPGHGEPGGPELLEQNIDHLRAAKQLATDARDSQTFRAMFRERYPEYRVPLMLMMSGYFLYDMPQAQANT